MLGGSTTRLRVNGDTKPSDTRGMSENLMDGLFKEMNRLREILPHYEAIPQGAFGAALIRQAIASAEQSIRDNDVVQMVVAYQNLKEITG